MNKLDKFAMAALTGMLANANRSHKEPRSLAIDSYLIAEEMEQHSKKVAERRLKQALHGTK